MLIPITMPEANELVENSQFRNVLRGKQDSAKLSNERLAELLSRFSQLIDSHTEILEAELDPLFAIPKEGFRAANQLFRIDAK